MKPKLILRAATAMLALATGIAHGAATPDPGDYTALPPGTDLLLLYGQHVSADKIYASGQQVVGNADLSLDVGILRYVHFTKLGGFTIDPQIIVPVGRQKLGLTGEKLDGALRQVVSFGDQRLAVMEIFRACSISLERVKESCQLDVAGAQTAC